MHRNTEEYVRLRQVLELATIAVAAPLGGILLFSGTHKLIRWLIPEIGDSSYVLAGCALAAYAICALAATVIRMEYHGTRAHRIRDYEES